MLSVDLWLYAMCTANEIMISTPTKHSDKSPQELFSGVNVLPKIKHFHTFACPTYVLDNALHGQHYLPKWQECARLGVYLGPSPNHSRTVHLILNLRTGHVSPQYHVKHDDFFKTITGKSSNFDSPEPTWKRLSGLVKNGHKRSSSSEGAATSLTPMNNTTRLDDLYINAPGSASTRSSLTAKQCDVYGGICKPPEIRVSSAIQPTIKAMNVGLTPTLQEDLIEE